MIKHSFRVMALILALGTCLMIGMLIGRSRVGNDLFVSFGVDIPNITTELIEDTSDAGGIDLNKATVDQLTVLPGIGETLAQRIIAYREEHGDFESIEDIMHVNGIGQSRFAEIKAYITVGG